MKRKKFDAVLFDIDGTILDTGDYIFKAYQHTLKLYLKKQITWKEVGSVMGLSLEECYRRLTNLKEVSHLALAHHEFQCQNFHLSQAYPNTLGALKALKKEGIAIAAVTNRSSDQLFMTLESAGIGKYFKIVITPEDVKNPKPDPEPVLQALKHLNIGAVKAVMVGDSPADIMAGKKAGVKTVAALYGFHGEKLLDLKPDYSVLDIKQIIPIILG